MGGSISSTSRPAPAIQPSCRALISAASTTVGPRPGVDEDRRLLHLPEVLLLEEADAPRGVAGRCMETKSERASTSDEARRLDASAGDREFVEERIDTPSGAGRTARARSATARATRPKAMKPSVMPHQARHLQQLRAALGPAAFAHHAILLDRAPVGGEQQHHGVIGHFLDEGVGAVGDGDALLGRGGDIDVVDADRAERDDAGTCRAPRSCGV